MTGVVLCGGQSIRMGHDKGLLFSEDRVWAKIMKEKLSQISIPTVLSLNSFQKESYMKYFEEKDLVVDRTTIKIHGPLLGLLSSHLNYPDQDLMVVACDMIYLDREVLLKLLIEYKSS